MPDSLVGLELDNGGVVFKFLKTAKETNGELHAQEARYAPRSPKPPSHRHPFQEERFVVLEGGMHFHVDGVGRDVKQGEEIVVPKASFHWARNPHDAPTVVLWETRPALRTADFFVAMNRAGRGKGKPPLHEAAAILREYDEVFELEKPSPLVQKVLFGCLAPFGRAALRR
ncbi:MAG TPA: cupin domain-containing protein [Polyangiaceae bacterium]|nr:cupin domain-containing protein [Polyangiaceae bacterium]